MYVFHICFDLCVVYGVGGCVHVCGVVCVVVCCLFLASGCCSWGCFFMGRMFRRVDVVCWCMLCNLLLF